MQISLDNNAGFYHIRAYTESFIQVNERKISHSLILHPKTLLEPWTVTQVSTLKPEDFNELLDLKPTIVLLGTGRMLNFPKPQLLQYFLTQQIGIEVMDTPAACRTYVALTAEGRSVVAALLIN